ncbi:MAG: hypothetical protein KAR40_08830 [Candidatus Sabulitectum sp.]|nr:hypothetical protein [Candidatus Sabulitectum sp.]
MQQICTGNTDEAFTWLEGSVDAMSGDPDWMLADEVNSIEETGSNIEFLFFAVFFLLISEPPSAVILINSENLADPSSGSIPALPVTVPFDKASMISLARCPLGSSGRFSNLKYRELSLPAGESKPVTGLES